MRRTGAIGALMAAGLLTGALAGSGPAGATTSSLAHRLLPASAARKLGFPSVANKATVSTKTGSKSCPTGAEVVYQNKKALTGLVVEIFLCKSPSAAKSLINEYQKSYAPNPTITPPKALGASAVASNAGAPVFVYYWTRGSYGAFVAIDTDATTNSRLSTLNRHNPLTPALQSSLDQAAIKQNAALY